MARTRSMLEEIIGHRRTVEIKAGRSSSVEDDCRKRGITEHM